MGTLWTPQESPGHDEAPSALDKGWLSWIRQSASLVYLAGGVFLIYQYWSHPRGRVVLAAGIILALYGLLRLYLIRRTTRRR